MNAYIVTQSKIDFRLSGNWNSPEWRDIPTLSIDNFLPESSGQRPLTYVKLLHDRTSIHVFFKVKDCCVRCTHTGYQAHVWKDSCVEWFVRPKPDKGYFNFEVNCGGSLHASYVEDPARLPDRSLKKSTPLSTERCSSITIFHSLPAIVEPEITVPTEWLIELAVPIPLFEHYLGPLENLTGQEWRANFYKCGDETSHPHWAAWNPVTEKNFHLPHEFGKITFC